MPWGRVDDTYYDHPKLDRLVDEHAWPDRLAAAGLNALAWSWCNRFLTDGHVPTKTVAKLGGTVELAEILVGCGLWEEASHGFQIHDFLVYNDSREQVLERRAKEAKRKADWRMSQRDKKATNGPDDAGPAGTTNGSGPIVPPSVPPSVPPGQRDVSRDSTRANPDPSRPVPTRPTNSSASGTSTREADVAGPTLTKAQLAAWATFGPEWEPFKAAWLARGFRHPPKGEPDDPTGQRGLLYPIVDARPTSITTWIREAKGKTAHDVVRHLIERWHQVQADAGVDDELPGSTRSRSTGSATSVGDILGDGPDWLRVPAEAQR